MHSYDICISVLSGVIAFAASAVATHKLIPILKKRNIVSCDLNKKGNPLIPEMGGIGVIIGFFIGINFFLIFFTSSEFIFLEITLFTVMGVAFIGIMDDLLDLRHITKVILPFLIAIPFGIIVSNISLTIPFVGSIELGWWTVLLVPVGVTAIVNLTNILEGFNGLGSGLGIIVTTTLIIISFISKETDALYLLIPLLGALIGFFYFNRFPSKIFPGDALTFFQGATIGCAAIIGNLKTIVAILYIPMIIEFILKARGRFPAENHGTITENGILKYDGKIYSLSHMFMKHTHVTEKRLVYILWTIEAILCVIMIVIVFLLGPEYAW
jgi:UDP-N-acetylglucosamine--dolichyl-phosphate N-acetylglucosaminephosphotransferase